MTAPAPITLGHVGEQLLELDLDRLVGPELIERDRTRGVRLKPEMMG